MGHIRLKSTIGCIHLRTKNDVISRCPFDTFVLYLVYVDNISRTIIKSSSFPHFAFDKRVTRPMAVRGRVLVI